MQENNTLLSQYVYIHLHNICMLSARAVGFAFHPKLLLSGLHVNENADRPQQTTEYIF